MPRSYKDFDPAWGEYDVESYVKYSLQPDPVSGHGPSRIPYGKDEGLYLKSERHPTFYKAVISDMLWGGRFYRNKKNGRIYSFEANRKVGPEFEEVEWTGPLFGTEQFLPKNIKNKATKKALDQKVKE